MATKRGEQSRLELTDFYSSRKENDYIEKHVLPTDTLQGIALQYNTTVADLKKLNNLHTDAALHAHRTIKVPARGILINLEPDTVPISLPPEGEEEGEEKEENGQTYLNNIDETLNEIREKAKNATANSVVGALETTLPIRKAPSRSQSELKWWKVFLPCLGTLIVFPILYFFYRQHLPSGSDEHQHRVLHD
jgi:LysM repeat protein